MNTETNIATDQHRIFTLESDIEADPVDELLEVHLLSEKELPNEENPDSGITKEIIRKDRLERARYGVSTRDIWDFGFHLMAIMANGFRELRNSTDDAEDKVRFDKLIRGCIALNERAAMNDMSFFKIPEKNAAESERWETKWSQEIIEFQKVLDQEWMNISREAAPFTWNRGTANAIVSRLEGKFDYAEKRDYLNDPITPAVPEEERNAHLGMRAYRGFSDWDLKYFRTYLVWLIAQASIFFASNDAHGYPQNEKHETFEAYSEFLIGIIGDLLRGEANTCTDRAMIFDLREKDAKNYADVIAQFTQFVPGLWD